MKIAIIGAGNMGGAVAAGLAKSTLVQSEDIICTARTQTTLDKIKAVDPEIAVTNDNAYAAKEADIIILAVKPWLMKEVIEDIRENLDPLNQIFVSVAAGVSLAELSNWIYPSSPSSVSVFRAIPNTAAAVLSSMTFIASANADADKIKLVCDIFDEIGTTMYVEEKLIPAGTALASCGIAFAMRYIRAASEGGVEIGFRPEEAIKIVEHTVKGAAELLIASGNHPEVEIDKVTTAGGITIKGLNEMEHEGFTSAVVKGLKACLS
jgi:pyrroline-5-carboxylate reductase